MVTVMSEATRPGDLRREAGVVVGDREALKRDLRELRRLQVRERQTASMVHDFNNLLTAITCSAALLEGDVDRGSRAASMVHEIQEASERAVVLVRRMLASTASLDHPPQPIDVGAIVVELEPLVARVVGEAIQVDLSVDGHAGFARVDRDELEHVLLNLAINARHAMPDGGRLGISTSRVTFDEHEAEVLAAEPGAYVALQVIDTGVGMAPEVRERVFERHFTTRPEGEGTGLGLEAAHRFAAESGGSIAVWSEPSQGTAVTIYLPCAEPQPLELLPAASDVLPRGTETIMVVEADEAVRRVVCTVLEQLGYVVLDAVSGDDAITLARDYVSPIHLVLTDVALPDVDGRELGSRMAAAGRTVRVLTMTGHPEDLAQRHGLPVLRKAFSALELAEKIREVLDAGEWV